MKKKTFTAQTVADVAQEVLEQGYDSVEGNRQRDEWWANRPMPPSLFDQICSDLEWLSDNFSAIYENIYHCCASGCETHGKIDSKTKEGELQFYVPSQEVAAALEIDPLEHVMCNKHRLEVSYHFDVIHLGVIAIHRLPIMKKELCEWVEYEKSKRYYHAAPLAIYLATKFKAGVFDIPPKALETSVNRKLHRDTSSLTESESLVTDVKWLVENFPILKAKTSECMYGNHFKKYVSCSVVNGDVTQPRFYVLSEGLMTLFDYELGLHIVCHLHFQRYMKVIFRELKMGSIVLRDLGIYGTPLTQYFISPFLLNEPTRYAFDQLYGHVPYEKVLNLVIQWLPKRFVP